MKRYLLFLCLTLVLTTLTAVYWSAQLSIGVLLLASSLFGFWVIARGGLNGTQAAQESSVETDLDLLDTLAQTIHTLLEDEVATSINLHSKSKQQPPISDIRVRAGFYELQAVVLEQNKVVERLARNLSGTHKGKAPWYAMFKPAQLRLAVPYLELLEREDHDNKQLVEQLREMRNLFVQGRTQQRQVNLLLSKLRKVATRENQSVSAELTALIEQFDTLNRRAEEHEMLMQRHLSETFSALEHTEVTIAAISALGKRRQTQAASLRERLFDL